MQKMYHLAINLSNNHERRIKFLRPAGFGEQQIIRFSTLSVSPAVSAAVDLRVDLFTVFDDLGDSREKKSLQCLRICKEYTSEVLSNGNIRSIPEVLLQLDPFLNELTSMFEKSKEKGSVWVTLKRSSLKSKLQKRKLSSAGESIEYRCLIRATDAKKTISTSVGAKDHLRFQASYATILKAHMTALKKRERKNRKKSTEAEKKEGTSTTTKPKKP
ncbi:hypothetical protein IGI04_017594 [Brassica rapa subsp. trilocularis]|uniref:Signal recognition particle 14 kDa protein n=1 Tax=Brassica rapa subsp. trilocularis TaxID=1813537 RepID=A0ABQ7MBL9_BRACM|nr:hypothetical protein IGI04_017594 [Brassica rapa subsp. trilocularis]